MQDRAEGIGSQHRNLSPIFGEDHLRLRGAEHRLSPLRSHGPADSALDIAIFSPDVIRNPRFRAHPLESRQEKRRPQPPRLFPHFSPRYDDYLPHRRLRQHPLQGRRRSEWLRRAFRHHHVPHHPGNGTPLAGIRASDPRPRLPGLCAMGRLPAGSVGTQGLFIPACRHVSLQPGRNFRAPTGGLVNLHHPFHPLRRRPSELRRGPALHRYVFGHRRRRKRRAGQGGGFRQQPLRHHVGQFGDERGDDRHVHHPPDEEHRLSTPPLPEPSKPSLPPAGSSCLPSWG